jgi:5-methylcytosine-specific restriction endonuclease McrA
MTRGVSQHKLYTPDWPEVSKRIKTKAGWKCEGCGVAHGPVPFVLAAHHIDFNPRNNKQENLIALCQRCHLKVQGMMVQPRTRYEIMLRLKQQGRQLYFK